MKKIENYATYGRNDRDEMKMLYRASIAGMEME
jgi:hypothetical protein